MFTGIVEETGTLLEAGELRMRFAAATVLGGVQLGDSIAVNGVCLTVTDFDGTSFGVDVVPETRRRSNLGDLAPGDLVNLERSLTPDGRMGGHIVQGHVEGTATVAAIEPDGDASIWRFTADPALLRYVVPKGFIAVDGMSLTVIDASQQGFSITIIPHTRDHSNLRTRRVGQRVNVETDIVGRYVERFVTPWTSAT